MKQKKGAGLCLPVPGQRILRSVIAVWVCLGFYLLRGRRGLPFYSVIAVLQCMQPYTDKMRTVARNRFLGTAIGAVWGAAALLLELSVFDGVPEEWVHFLLLGFACGVVIYSTVLMKVTESSYFSCVVFFSITMNHIGDENPYLFVFSRLMDTVIGIAIALLVNSVHLPRGRVLDTLFVSGVSDAILGVGKKLRPYSKVELNRLIADGAKFTVSTMQTPATVRELMDGVNLPYPIIAMDGAVLYDMKRMEYVKTVSLSDVQAERMARFLDTQGIPFFLNTIEDNLLVIRYRELANDAMRRLYETKRRSPYRNYARLREGEYQNTVYFLVLERSETIAALKERIQAEPWAGDYRVVADPTLDQDGWSGLRICSAVASRESMLRELEARMGTSRTVTFGSVQRQYDVYIENADRDLVVKELKRRFEPVDLRCWKRIFRF